MVVGVLRITVTIPDSTSLKMKRSAILPLKVKIRNKFQVSAAEVAHLDNLRLSELGIAIVSNDTRHVDEIMAKIADYVEFHAGECVVEGFHTEVVHLG